MCNAKELSERMSRTNNDAAVPQHVHIPWDDTELWLEYERLNMGCFRAKIPEQQWS